MMRLGTAVLLFLLLLAAFVLHPCAAIASDSSATESSREVVPQPPSDSGTVGAPQISAVGGPATRAEGQTASAEDSVSFLWLKPDAWHWQFEVYFAVFLVLVGIWAIGVVWVERDAEERRYKDAIWMPLVMLGFIPGIALYAIYRCIAGVSPPPPEPTEEEDTEDYKPMERVKVGQRKPRQPLFRMAPPSSITEVPRLEILNEEGKPVLLVPKQVGMNVLPILQDILRRALEVNASDLHLEPSASDFQVRYRIDGEFRVNETLPRETGMRLISSLKTLACIDVADRRRAQDGSFRIRYMKKEMDMRVATSNTIHGETMVLRMLSMTGGYRGLTEIGLTEQNEAFVREALGRRSGMVLIVGPTGSGKTSTAYAALNLFDPQEKKIMTIEDPVEYRLEGATQIPVNPTAGMTYEAGLQSILRQDPDIIFVGEMRNRLATEAAITAAMTGRLVISTLHATSAAGAISRMRDMGVEPYQIASVVSLVIAQRLVRANCPECMLECHPSEEEVKLLAEAGLEVERLYRGAGCKRCRDTGLFGRTGIFEVLPVTPEIKGVIIDKLPQEEIAALAREVGMRTLWEDAMWKVATGVTTLEEARKVF